MSGLAPIAEIQLRGALYAYTSRPNDPRAGVPSAKARLRRHPATRSHGHRDVADAGDGRMRACAIACQASRCARMSSSAVLRSASRSSAKANCCLSSASALASAALRQGMSDRTRLSDEAGATVSIS